MRILNNVFQTDSEGYFLSNEIISYPFALLCRGDLSKAAVFWDVSTLFLAS